MLYEHFMPDGHRILVEQNFALGVAVKILFCHIERSRNAAKKIATENPPERPKNH